MVAWGSEETGGSGVAYAAAHVADAARIVVAGESDLGAGRVYRLALPKSTGDDALRSQLAATLGPLGIFVSAEPAADGGSDLAQLHAAGVPVLSYQQDAAAYFDIHHSADDTLDKIDRADLDQNVGAWAALLYLVGESDVNFR